MVTFTSLLLVYFGMVLQSNDWPIWNTCGGCGGEIGKLTRYAYMLCTFAYVFAMFAASRAPMMVLPNAASTRGAAFGRPLMDSIMGAREGGKHCKNISKCISIMCMPQQLFYFPVFSHRELRSYSKLASPDCVL